MKVIGVACSARNGSESAALVKEVLRGAQEAGHETELFVLTYGKFHGCTGCHLCKEPGATGCIQKDAMTPYFEALPDADVVVFGAGNYMGWPNGDAWNFVQRHFSLNAKMFSDCRIPAGKKLIPCFSQGVPKPEMYKERYEALVKPFQDWGFVQEDMLITCGPMKEEMLKKAYEMGMRL